MDISRIVNQIKKNGYSIVEDIIEERIIKKVTNEIDKLLNTVEFSVGDFYGYKTKRAGGLFKKAPSTIDLALNPLCLKLAAKFLECDPPNVRLSFSQAIEIHPGEVAQEPHIDQSMWPLNHQEIVAQVGFIWPLTEFTRRNGATRLWPRSHLHADPGRVDVEMTDFAEMLPGSVLCFLGSTVHSGGANLSMNPRSCVMIAYCRGWLKPFENQWLTYPPEIARQFTEPLASLIGYKIQHPNLGNVDGRCPSFLLRDTYVDQSHFEDTIAD
tara:strand:- start:363 stop:1169 length:807 start_codon:yes stop_codon:yes gene_type:complete